MKKYLLMGGLATTLMLGACGGEEESASTNENNDAEKVEQLEAENEELRTQIEDLQEQLDNTSMAAEEESTSDDSSDSEGEVGNDSTRTNPLALGETAEVKITTYDDEAEELNGVANVTIDNVVRGQEALDMMSSDGMSYDAPDEEGYEWAVFDLTFELVEFVDADTPISLGEDVSIINEDGSQAPLVTAVIDDEFPIGELYEGGTASGKVARPVPEGEPFIIKYDDYIDAQAFYEVE
ncbi:bZIP transcription factor [Salinicoccus sp. CNSTN-B1]